MCVNMWMVLCNGHLQYRTFIFIHYADLSDLHVRKYSTSKTIYHAEDVVSRFTIQDL